MLLPAFDEPVNNEKSLYFANDWIVVNVTLHRSHRQGDRSARTTDRVLKIRVPTGCGNTDFCWSVVYLTWNSTECSVGSFPAVKYSLYVPVESPVVFRLKI